LLLFVHKKKRFPCLSSGTEFACSGCARTRKINLQATTTNGNFPGWEPRGVGLPGATAVAVLLVAAIITLCIWVSTDLGPKPVPQSIQVTQATLTQLPRPAPPPPPKIVPPPKPVPAVIPKPPPVASKIMVATKPPPVVHHVAKPVPHPVLQHAPAPPKPAPVVNHAPPAPAPVSAAPQPAAPPTSGIGPYGNQMYGIIQANQSVPPALAQLGVSGTAVIEIWVAPNGHILSAKVYKSSGNPLVDQTALEHARDAALPPFNSQMPSQPHAFLIPIEIKPLSD
jgi:protein TonB